MITFKTFLEAENKPFDSEAVDVEKIAAAIEKNCSEAVSNWRMSEEGQMWRGSKKTRASGVFRPDTGTRQSANTANYYTVLLDSNPLNDGWPKRSKSFICTTRHKTAKGYSRGGAVYAVFPFDGVPIGQVNKDDIWETTISFGNGGEFVYKDKLQAFNQDFWPEMHRALGFEAGWTPTMSELIKAYESASPLAFGVELADQGIIRDRPDEKYSKKLLESFLKQLPTAYSFKSMGCALKQPDTYEDPHTELWFSGPCIMVNNEDWVGVSMELGL